MIIDDSNIDLLIVTSPARSGSTFLLHLLSQYFSKQNLKKEYLDKDKYRQVIITHSGHNFLLLRMDIPNTFNIMVARDPVDSISSMILFGQDNDNVVNNTYFGHYDKFIEKSINSILGFFDNFFSSNKNILISFEKLTKNKEEVFKFFSDLLNRQYDKDCYPELKELEKAVPKKNFPQPDLIHKQEQIKKYLLSLKTIQDVNNRYNKFLSDAYKNNVEGIYG